MQLQNVIEPWPVELKIGKKTENYTKARERLLLHFVGGLLAHGHDSDGVTSSHQILGSPEANDGVTPAVSVHNQHLLRLPCFRSHGQECSISAALTQDAAIALHAPWKCKAPWELGAGGDGSRRNEHGRANGERRGGRGGGGGGAEDR